MAQQFTFDFDGFSDLHKEAYGFRPRGHWFYDNQTTDEQRQEIWEHVLSDAQIAYNQERIAEAKAVVRFDRLVQDVIAMGAGNKETAIRWLKQADSDFQDEDFFRWEYGLPWKYQLVA